MVLFSLAAEELVKPKSQFFGGGKVTRGFCVCVLGSRRNGSSLVEQALEEVADSFLASRVKEIGASRDCCAGMLGESRREPPLMDCRRNEGAVEAIGFRGAQPMRRMQMKMYGSNLRARVGREGFTISRT